MKSTVHPIQDVGFQIELNLHPYAEGLRLAALFDIPNAILVFGLGAAIFAAEQRNTSSENRTHADGGVYEGEWKAGAGLFVVVTICVTRFVSQDLSLLALELSVEIAYYASILSPQ